MRQKSTVNSPSFHNQFQETRDGIGDIKREIAEHVKRDEKQGQSKFRVDKVVKK